MSKSIEIYTDGAARGNPGPGGFGVVLLSGNHRREISEGFRLTTNNRMELLSVIVALESLRTESLPVTIYSDSRYVVDAVEKGWLWNWKRQGFKKTKNPDLWKRFLEIYPRFRIRFQWVKGHASNVENNRCDELAVKASFGSHLPADEYYEQHVSENGGQASP